MTRLEPDNCGNYVVQDSTIKNDIRYNRVKDELNRVKDELNRVEDELNRVKDELEPITKNDLPHCQHTDEEIAKSFIEDVEAVKDQLHTKNDLGVDCISRKSVITIIQNHWWNCRDIDKLVNDLPSVTPQEPSWIPVAERLPEENERILLNVRMPHYQAVRSGMYHDELFSLDNGDCWRVGDIEVVAWQSLPKPYKAESDSI